MKTSLQLKNLINNKAKKFNLNPQTLLNRFFMERFLERISISRYKNNFVLKGGILISSMVGIDSRMTKDMDLVIQKLRLDENVIKGVLEEIIAIEIDDATKFTLLGLVPIREGADYQGFKARLDVAFDKTRTGIQIDITAGDKITPSEIRYSYHLLLENRSIDIASYPIETILSEKIECILSRSVANTRMKDYYDCYILSRQQEKPINYETLLLALKNTVKARKSEPVLENVDKNIELIKNDDAIKRSWLAYSKQFAYASGISFEEVVLELEALLKKVEVF
ncbi:MAG: nucleotidyl transferase AbiEii/AbiGii toxin family protein [Fibromonadaceae bacterium]|nr:nucleotidyl transferase AbiEii/AbiGii toxin family protein [Fibromonadaceae bacterium]